MDADRPTTVDAAHADPDATATADAGPDCDDPDHDGYGTGPECLGLDCAPDDPEIYPGQPELCDELDNNCTDGVDELPECALPRLTVVILAGQSNMVGLGVSSELGASDAAAVPHTYIYYNDSVHTNSNAEQWLGLGPGFGVSGAHFGPELQLGRQLQQHWPDRDIAFIKVAEGGTTLFERWDVQTGDLYQLLVTEVQAELTDLAQGWRPQVVGFIWMQGESDAIESANALAYHDNLLDLMQSLRLAIGVETLPTVAGLIAVHDYWPQADTVRSATSEVAGELGQMSVIETTDLPRHPNDLAHYTSAGNLELGVRFADALAALLPTSWQFFDGFSAVQGEQFWSYLHETDTVAEPLTYNNSDSAWQDSISGAAIGRGWMQPGAAQAAELIWTAPYAGRLELQVEVSAVDGFASEGVRVEVARGGTRLWAPAAVPASGSATFTVQRFVQPGDRLQFRTGPGSVPAPANSRVHWQIGLEMIAVDGQ